MESVFLMDKIRSYVNAVLQTYSKAVKALVEDGISREVIDFHATYKKPRPPTAAFSNFLINREMGDWAEDLLQAEMNYRLSGIKVLKYGNSGRILVGDPRFRKFFHDYHEEVANNGKRPDLLVFREKVCEKMNLPEDISELEWQELPKIARSAEVGIEVRSSKYYACEYQKKKGKPQSFTPKLEDISIVTRWIVVHQIPHFYVQIFFDSVHIISFQKILEIISDTGKHHIKQMQRNQGKSTFYIPLPEGKMIAKFKEQPSWEGSARKAEDGRVEPYVIPRGGKLDLDIDTLVDYLGI